MSSQHGNTFNFLVVFTAALGSFTYGFNGTVLGGVFGLPSFWTYFDISIQGTSAIVGGSFD
jgi:hypothetical protein